MNHLQITTRPARFGATVIELSGRLDKGASEQLEKALQELEADGQVKIVVSCKGLGYLSSEASGVFLSHLIRIKKSGGDIRFCDVPPAIHSTLTVLGLSKLLVIFDSENAALAGYADTEKPRREESPGKLRLIREDLGEQLVVLTPRGTIDRHTIEDLDTMLMNLLYEGRTQIVINGQELSYVSSNGMGVFISFLGKLNAQGGDLKFFALNDIVRTVITTLGLHRLFQIYGTRQEAIDSISGH